MGIYWNKDAKTEGEEPPTPAKAKAAARPRTGPPASGTRAWTSTPGADAAGEGESDEPSGQGTGPKGARKPASNKG